MRCNGNDRIPFSTKQGKGPSSQDEGGKTGLFLCCVRTLGLGSSAAGYVRELLQLPQGGQGPFRGSRGKVGFLSRCCSGKGPHFALRGQSPGFSRVDAGNFGFLSSYDGDLMELLMWPQESPVSMRVARDFSGFLSHLCQVLSPHLELRPQPQASSSVLTWISGFLCSLHRGVRPRLIGDMQFHSPPEL